MSQKQPVSAEETLEESSVPDNPPISSITYTNTTTSCYTADAAGPAKLPLSASRYTNLGSGEQQAQDLEDSIVLQEAETLVVVDLENEYEAYEESDDGYETASTGTDVHSVASSSMNYVYEHGRRYHSYRDGAYNFSNDESEQDRESAKHHMMQYLCHGRRYHAPIGSNPQNILDLGTGIGLWAIDMADEFPSAQVVGIDLSPIQTSWIPPNLEFTLMDIEESWNRTENHYDFIHTRHIVMAVKDWPRLLQESLLHLKPGGWMEMQEINHFPELLDHSTLQPPHPLATYWWSVHEALKLLKVNFHSTKFLLDMMKEAGFVNVQQRIYYVPIGDWHRNSDLKEAGRLWKEILVQGLDAISLGTFTRGLGWTKEEVDEMVVSTRHAYLHDCPILCMPLHCVYGQKPFAKRKASDISKEN